MKLTSAPTLLAASALLGLASEAAGQAGSWILESPPNVWLSTAPVVVVDPFVILGLSVWFPQQNGAYNYVTRVAGHVKSETVDTDPTWTSNYQFLTQHVTTSFGPQTLNPTANTWQDEVFSYTYYTGYGYNGSEYSNGIWIGPNQVYSARVEFKVLQDDVGNGIVLPEGGATEKWSFRLGAEGTLVDSLKRETDRFSQFRVIESLVDVPPPPPGDIG